MFIIERPNILLITTDTQRWDTCRFMGNPHAISPNLDRLAREGTYFEQCHTSSAVCAPARCSLITGLHTPIHGCIENGTQRRADLPVLPDMLKKQGYTTIMSGKTHFTAPVNFDIQTGTSKAYDRHIEKLGLSESGHPVSKYLHHDELIVECTIHAIEETLNEQCGPFFAFCSLDAPHEPFQPPGHWGSIYDNVPLPEINYIDGEILHLPLQLKRMLGIEGKEDELTLLYKQIHDPDSKIRQQIDKERRLYFGFAAYCDYLVGRLLDYLGKRELRENTLVLFSSDHGREFYDHGFADKHNYYDHTWRVPLIMSMPGTLPQGVSREFAVWNDLTATILGAAGAEEQTVQGFDLFTPLKDWKPSPRRCAIGTLYKSAAIATRFWKLEYYFEERIGRLFDRVNDPREQHDLFCDPAYGEVRAKLVEALLSWRSDIVDLHSLILGSPLYQTTAGPVASRLIPHTRAMRGIDAEIRLNQWADEIDAAYPPVVKLPCTENTFVYKTVDQIQLKLKVYSPRGTQAGDAKPAIVFFFGGGWMKGRLEQFEPQSQFLSSLGMIAITADYRVYERHGTTPFESVEDAKSAIAWIRSHAYELGIDPQKLAAGGGSAGGHLAAATSMLPASTGTDNDKPDLLVLFNPVVDLTSLNVRNEAIMKVMDRLKELSPIFHVRPGLPPTIIFHGDQDTGVPIEQVERFRDVMKKAGNECILMPFTGRRHGFFNSDPDLQETMWMTKRFLQKHGFMSN